MYKNDQHDMGKPWLQNAMHMKIKRSEQKKHGQGFSGPLAGF